jgi:hypothetical protein
MTSADPADYTKLVQVLRIYGAGLNPGQLHDLRSSLAHGRYPWLRATFARAIADTAFDRTEWSAIVGDPSRSTGVAAMRAEQRLIWSRIFPDIPFPAPPRRRAVSASR